MSKPDRTRHTCVGPGSAQKYDPATGRLVPPSCARCDELKVARALVEREYDRLHCRPHLELVGATGAKGTP